MLALLGESEEVVRGARPHQATALIRPDPDASYGPIRVLVPRQQATITTANQTIELQPDARPSGSHAALRPADNVRSSANPHCDPFYDTSGQRGLADHGPAPGRCFHGFKLATRQSAVTTWKPAVAAWKPAVAS